MPIFSISYVYNDDRVGREANLPAHRTYLAGWVEKGLILLAGPLGDDEEPGALFIVDAASKASVAQLTDADPLVTGGQVESVTTTEWIPKSGRFIDQL